jgi:hypothetical protein
LNVVVHDFELADWAIELFGGGGVPEVVSGLGGCGFAYFELLHLLREGLLGRGGTGGEDC